MISLHSFYDSDISVMLFAHVLISHMWGKKHETTSVSVFIVPENNKREIKPDLKWVLNNHKECTRSKT